MTEEHDRSKIVHDRSYRRLFYIVIACLMSILLTGAVVIMLSLSGKKDASQAEANQAVALCLASKESELTRQTTLALIAVAHPDLSERRRNKLDNALEELDLVLTQLVNAENGSNVDICQRAIDLNLEVGDES